MCILNYNKVSLSEYLNELCTFPMALRDGSGFAVQVGGLEAGPESARCVRSDRHSIIRDLASCFNRCSLVAAQRIGSGLVFK